MNITTQRHHLTTTSLHNNIITQQHLIIIAYLQIIIKSQLILQNHITAIIHQSKCPNITSASHQRHTSIAPGSHQCNTSVTPASQQRHISSRSEVHRIQVANNHCQSSSAGLSKKVIEVLLKDRLRAIVSTSVSVQVDNLAVGVSQKKTLLD